MAGKESNKTKQELRAMQSDVVPEPTAPELVLPVFWDGKSPIGCNVHVSRPAPHKLAAWPRETPEQEADLIKYWGYDIQ